MRRQGDLSSDQSLSGQDVRIAMDPAGSEAAGEETAGSGGTDALPKNAFDQTTCCSGRMPTDIVPSLVLFLSNLSVHGDPSAPHRYSDTPRRRLPGGLFGPRAVRRFLRHGARIPGVLRTAPAHRGQGPGRGDSEPGTAVVEPTAGLVAPLSRRGRPILRHGRQHQVAGPLLPCPDWPVRDGAAGRNGAQGGPRYIPRCLRGSRAGGRALLRARFCGWARRMNIPTADNGPPHGMTCGPRPPSWGDRGSPPFADIPTL